MKLYKCEGLVLRGYDLGETDRLLTLYSKEKGKIKVVANGVRRTKSKFSGAAMLFVHSSYVIYPGKSLDYIRQVDIINSFPVLRENFKKMAYASYGSELIDKSVELEDKSGSIFKLILNFLSLLEKTDKEELLSRIFELKLLSFLGYQPHLNGCILCGSNLEKGKVSLSISQGGTVCRKCRKEADRLYSLTPGALKTAQHILNNGFKSLKNLYPETTVISEIETINRRYIDYHLDTVLKSLDFLDVVKKIG